MFGLRTGIFGTGVALLVATATLAQPSGPSFEVASVKRAAPPVEGKMQVTMGRDPGRVNFTNVTLRDLMAQAYQVKDYQISGPDWMASERYDVVATVPSNTPADQVRLMMQNLLAERFQLALHRESRERDVYALTVGKDGPKLKTSAVDAPVGPGFLNAPPAGRGAPGPPNAVAGRGELPPKEGAAPRGALIRMGRGHVEANGVTVTAFCDLLSRFLDRPVLNDTSLTGNYDFTLDWTPDESQSKSPFGPGMPEPPEAKQGVEAAATPGATIFTAVQEQLGLKLESRKGPVEMLMVDRAEKVPTEN